MGEIGRGKLDEENWMGKIGCGKLEQGKWENRKMDSD